MSQETNTSLALAEDVKPAEEPAKKKDATDFFIEEYGDAWPLEMVKFSQDDGGKLLDIYIAEQKVEEFRLACPRKYLDLTTIVIGVEEGWGKS